MRPHLVKPAVGVPNGDDIKLLDQHLPDSLVSKIGLAQNFFYYITQPDDFLMASERGIGEIYVSGEDHFLKRERAVSYKHGQFEAPSRPDAFYYFDQSELVAVTTYVPDRYVDALLSPYSVLCSIEENTPSPVELEDHALLGRLDGRIQSIDKHELRTILTDQLIVTALAETATPINVKTGVFNLSVPHSTVSSHVVQLKPAYGDSTRPPKAQRGSIIFNDEHGCFEGYDGKEWRPLLWGPNENT